MRFKKNMAGALTFAIIAGTILQINAETPIAASISTETEVICDDKKFF